MFGSSETNSICDPLRTFSEPTFQNGRLVLRSKRDDFHHSSGYGHSSYGHSSHGLECCPLVVDTLTLYTLLGAIGIATFFLNNVIMDTLMAAGTKRRRRRGINWNRFGTNGTAFHYGTYGNVLQGIFTVGERKN